MAIKSRGVTPNPPYEIKLPPGEASNIHPFKISIVSTDNATKECSVSINAHSHVLKGQNILDFVSVLGKNLKLGCPYGSKVWLEVLFNSSREPVIGFIRVGSKWEAQTKNSSGAAVDVYPDCEEFISREDLPAKVTELDGLISYISELQTLSEDELDFQRNNGLISEREYQLALSALAPAFQAYKDDLALYKAEFSKFFVASPSVTWKKLFRLYHLIGYTTKDQSGTIPGYTAYFSNEGSLETPAVPQASKTNNYKIVQCANSDLMLQDSWSYNAYPSKILIPYSRAVHTFQDGQKTEEENNA